MSEADQFYFVWVRGLSGPEPQKWAELDFGVGDWKKRYVLVSYPLNEAESSLSLDQLCRLYPSPTKYELH